MVIEMTTSVADTPSEESHSDETPRPIKPFQASPERKGYFVRLREGFNNVLTRVRSWTSGESVYNRNNRLADIRIEKIEDKKEGYPRLAATINSDVNFALYREFGYLRNRLLLHKQAKLTKLMDRLDMLDDNDAKEDPFILQTIETSFGGDQAKRELLGEIDKELKDYDELLLREQKMKAIERPTRRNYQSLFNYVWQEKPLGQDEAQTFFYKDDFISLASGQDSTLLDGMIEDVLNLFPGKTAQKLFTKPEKRMKSSTGDIRYYSQERIGILSKAITVLVTIALLMIPVSLLFAVNCTQTMKIIIVLLFVLIFPGAITTCTRAKHQEIFAATAAYCAVLVVFLGNFKVANANGPNPGGGQLAQAN